MTNRFIRSLFGLYMLSALSAGVNADTTIASGNGYDVIFGGYAKVDFIADFDGHRNKNQFLMRGITVEGDPDYNLGGYTNFHGRETRFHFDFRRNDDSNLPEQFFLEMDFYDESTKSPRLRHAYIQQGDFIVGQTWTNVTDLAAIPYYIDFAFGEALYGGRRYQIRWQPQLSESLQFGVSIEESSDSNIDNPFNLPGQETSRLPIATARLSHTADTYHVNVATEISQLYWDGSGFIPSQSATSWVALLSGHLDVTNDGVLRVAMTHGKGAAKGVLALAASGSGATLNSQGELDLDMASTLSVSYTHQMTESLSGNVGYAWLKVDPSPNRSSSDIDESGIGHVNVIYQLNDRVDTGIEYIWGGRYNIDGAYGLGRRLQAMVRFTF